MPESIFRQDSQDFGLQPIDDRRLHSSPGSLGSDHGQKTDNRLGQEAVGGVQRFCGVFWVGCHLDSDYLGGTRGRGGNGDSGLSDLLGVDAEEIEDFQTPLLPG